MTRQPVVISNAWVAEGLQPPPDESLTGTPERRPNSVRRTSHIHMTWPAGPAGPIQYSGRARDLLTPATGEPRVLETTEMVLDVDASRVILAIAATPWRPALSSLVGRGSVRGMRHAISEVLPDERTVGSPLTFMLDEIPIFGTAVGGAAWTQHRTEPVSEEQLARSLEYTRNYAYSGKTLCSGLRPGGYNEISLDKRISFPHYLRAAGDLTNPDDEWAWHEIEAAPAICSRRRRRIDAWRSGDVIEIDAHHRDSVWGPQHDEVALHEYSLRASYDANTHRLLSVGAIGQVLPFPECPFAATQVDQLVGQSIDDLRDTINDSLSSIHCCTHLNDMLRGLSDVPALAGQLSS